MEAQDIINFWFHELRTDQWFKIDPDLDEVMMIRFQEIHAEASRGELFRWRKSPMGRLAEILILDQFSRNIYRHHPECYATDIMALLLAQEMVLLGLDKELPENMRPFVYMPYMHSESRVIHEEAMRLFSQPGMEEHLPYELDHKSIIDRFGRYPHRNMLLNRLSTVEELRFLEHKHETYGAEFTN